MDEIRLGEVVRSLARLENSQREQNDKLDEIREQTFKTNGTLLLHEQRLKDLESRDRRRAHHHQHEMKRTTDRPDMIALYIPAGAVSPKVLALVISALVSGMIAAWKAGLFS